MGLIPEADLQRAHERYLQERATPPTKSLVEILIETAAEFPDATTAELAEAAGRSRSWVNRTLRTAGVVRPKPPKKPKAPRRKKPARVSLPAETQMPLELSQ